MPITESSSSAAPSSIFSILSRRRDQVHSIEPPPHSAADTEAEAFQRHVADRFNGLAAADSGSLLSIPWLRSLLDAFLRCQEEFTAIMAGNAAVLRRTPVDRAAADYFDRSVKALDVCNAVRDGIELIRQWKKQLEIVLAALDGRRRTTGDAQFRRAKKALVDLALGMLDRKQSAATFATRNRSFGRHHDQKSPGVVHSRSLSWSVSRSWSAAKQLQALCNNLTPPRPNEMNGVSLSVFTMSHVLVFTMWALVAAIPCQDRGLQAHFHVPKQFPWAGAILSLRERILEESKRANACGLLREIREIERCSRRLNELVDSAELPLSEEREREVKERVEEVRNVSEGLKSELDPLESQVRQVFHCIVRSRTQGLVFIT
ncbi:protein ROH1-like [Salvia hispanica]|uniref:protein ROH1-like n=1 Tax=Salvia hispanica TaxID=49212 RepID=UPI002009A395|nr:protein ROH1-like [Salvia hispanica]